MIYLEEESGEDSGSTMTRPGEEEDLNILSTFGMSSDEVASVGVCESQPGASTPMAEQSRLHVVLREFIIEKGVRLEKDLSCCEIVRGSLKGEKALDIDASILGELDLKVGQASVWGKAGCFWRCSILIWHD
jgi:hypothetical protein